MDNGQSRVGDGEHVEMDVLGETSAETEEGLLDVKSELS